MIISRSIHVASNGVILFIFMTELYSTVYMYHIIFIHSSVKVHLSFVCVLIIVNSAAVTIGGHGSFGIRILSRSGQKIIVFKLVKFIHSILWCNLEFFFSFSLWYLIVSVKKCSQFLYINLDNMQFFPDHYFSFSLLSFKSETCR